MHKRKYTKEQLEFYFKRLMDKLKRLPHEEDLAKDKNTPSVQAYVARFGSWNNAIKMFGNLELAKRKCLNCGKILVKKNKRHKFCTELCARTYYLKKSNTYTKTIDKKIKDILNNKCFVCDFEQLLEIHNLDNKKESTHKILHAYNNKDLTQFVLLCPNHHLMIHKKLGKLYHRDGQLIWEE